MFMFTYFAFYYSRFCQIGLHPFISLLIEAGINQVLVSSGKSRSLPETSINIKQYKTVDQASSQYFKFCGEFLRFVLDLCSRIFTQVL